MLVLLLLLVKKEREMINKQQQEFRYKIFPPESFMRSLEQKLANQNDRKPRKRSMAVVTVRISFLESLKGRCRQNCFSTLSFLKIDNH